MLADTQHLLFLIYQRKMMMEIQQTQQQERKKSIQILQQAEQNQRHKPLQTSIVRTVENTAKQRKEKQKKAGITKWVLARLVILNSL